MIATNHRTLTAIGLLVFGWGARIYAEGGVTIYQPAPTANPPPAMATTADGTPVIHKSIHKKKLKSAATVVRATPGGAPASVKPAGTSASTVPPKAVVQVPTPTPAHSPIVPIVTQKPPAPVAPAPALAQIGAILPSDAPAPLVPAVETGLPIPRHVVLDGSPGIAPPSASYQSPGPSYAKPFTHSLTPLSPVVPETSSTPYSAPGSSGNNFAFTNYESKTRTYPWKRDIITTKFWIGEGGSTISPTDNIGSAWDQDWRTSNGGTDSPDDRISYGPAGHAARVNTFYVALPFNDLAYPDKTRRWLPSGWYRPPKNGKQVSACKDRWVEIESAQGDTCYAQWEDVGPLRSDHAEYVFGNDRPDTYTRAGLDVSPAVFKYLNLDGGKNRYTAWRFVDAEDVPPGFWLKYDEQAVLFSAIHDLKNAASPSGDEPVQRSISPIDDPSNIDSNKKKVGAAKG